MSLFDDKPISLFSDDECTIKKNKQEKTNVIKKNNKKINRKKVMENTNNYNNKSTEKENNKKNEKKIGLEIKKKQNIKSPKTKKIDEKIDYKRSQELKEITSFSSIENKLLLQFQKNRLHHALMFSGNYGIGKATFAYWLASRMILSENKQNDNKTVIKMHENLLRENTHPDVMFLNLDNGNDEIKIEQVRKLLEKIIFKSTYGSKIAIIDDINSININGINALLKTLEEPPENTFFFIINHNVTNIPDTIRSRCNEIKLSLSNEECKKILKQIHQDLNDNDVQLYSEASGNSVNFANMLIAIGFKEVVVEIYKDKNIKIANLLNNICKQLDTQFKFLSRILKIALLEQIIMFFINNSITNDLKNSCANFKQNIKQNTNLLQQFRDIKLYELPIKFV